MSTSRIGARAVGYRKVLVATSTGTLIEVYDILIYGYFATVLSQQFFPPGDPTAALLATFAIFAVGFFLRPLWRGHLRPHGGPFWAAHRPCLLAAAHDAGDGGVRP